MVLISVVKKMTTWRKECVIFYRGANSGRRHTLGITLIGRSEIRMEVFQILEEKVDYKVIYEHLQRNKAFFEKVSSRAHQVHPHGREPDASQILENASTTFYLSISHF